MPNDTGIGVIVEPVWRVRLSRKHSVMSEPMEIWRLPETHWGTFGVWTFNHIPRLVTLEHKWVDNQQDISCIPPELWWCEVYESETHGLTLHILDVPDRGRILFHIGNSLQNTLGCVLVGLRFGYVEQHQAHGILSSRLAMEVFRGYLPQPGERVPLVIRAV